jgi:hypothetical protein
MGRLNRRWEKINTIRDHGRLRIGDEVFPVEYEIDRYQEFLKLPDGEIPGRGDLKGHLIILGERLPELFEPPDQIGVLELSNGRKATINLPWTTESRSFDFTFRDPIDLREQND